VFVLFQKDIEQSKGTRPKRSTQETVRDRIVIEVEWCYRRVSGIDPHMLESEQQEEGPKKIDELGGEKESAKGDARGCLFRCQSDCIVTKKHFNLTNVDAAAMVVRHVNYLFFDNVRRPNRVPKIESNTNVGSIVFRRGNVRLLLPDRTISGGCLASATATIVRASFSAERGLD
jgi:hypothetical protein